MLRVGLIDAPKKTDMYSKELEEIIEAALADGEITEKERAVLHKRAIAEGVDPDELDVVIEGRLAKMQRIERDWLRPSPPPIASTPEKKSDKWGEVRKCPNCGAVVESGAMKCKECDYTFVGISGNSSVQRLSDQLMAAESKHSNDGVAKSFLGELGIGGSRAKTMCNIIQTFPIPNTKEDLIEFILFLHPKATNTSVWKVSDRDQLQMNKAYKVKFDECVNKAKFLLKDDPQMLELLAQHGIKLNKKKFGLF